MRSRILAALFALQAFGAVAAPAPYRFAAAIEVDQPGSFVQLPLPPTVYGRSEQPDLQDLRIVDADGEPVPFAWLPPRAAERSDVERLREAAAYPLPQAPARGEAGTAPVEVVVQGDRLSVRRLPGAPLPADASPPGWLFDLGERAAGEPAPQALRLRWSAAAEFSASYSFETSDDLRQWRPGGSGQVMALGRGEAALAQPRVALPAGTGRFIRLRWQDPATAPRITGAQAVVAEARERALDPPTRLVFAGVPDGRGLRFDLGGRLPLAEVELQWSAGSHLALLHVQGRDADGEPWRELASAVFYRLERPEGHSSAPAVALQARVRQLRLLPDERAAALAPEGAQLVVQARLAHLVFAHQGRPPFRLLAGSPAAPAGALPLATLVPALADERLRFGAARLGEWQEVADVARQRQAEQQRAALRPWLLWAVLLAGVAGLAAMVWRLLRV